MLQPSPSSCRDSAALVSESTPDPFDTQPDPLLPQDSPQDSENCQATNFPSREPTLANIMLAIQDCKASCTTQIASICMDFSLLKQDVHNLRDRTGAVRNV